MCGWFLHTKDAGQVVICGYIWPPGRGRRRMSVLTNDRLEEYKQFLESSPKGHFAQSKEWSYVKSEWKNEIIVSRDQDGKINGGISVLIRKVPFFNATLMYAPRGPVCDVHDKKVIAALMEDVRALAKKHRAFLFKIDPDIEADDTEFVDMMKSFGFKQKSASKNFEGIQPRFVFRLDVKGKTEEEVLASFHSKTRYNIKVAIKNDVTVTVGKREDIGKFQEIMLETGLRDGFVIRSKEYFEKMFDQLGSHIRLYVARHEGEIIAGTLAILYGNKVWYLYGASSNAKRNVMPNYLLQWEMIKWAIEGGCNLYDFTGVPYYNVETHPNYGVFKFKSGFNGRVISYAGEFDYPLIPVLGKALRTYLKKKK